MRLIPYLRSLLSAAAFAFVIVHAEATPTLGGKVSPDGKVKVTIDVPAALRAKNTGGTDGAGLCVWTSIMHAARWQGETPLCDLQKIMQREPGGGWPARVNKKLPGFNVDFAQYEGRDPISIKLALASNRLPSVTYAGRDPHYRGSISHMVNCVHFDEVWVCILDNNYIGENELVWMSPSEFLERWMGKGSGWTVLLLREPTPPTGVSDEWPPVETEAQPKAPRRVISGDELGPTVYQWYYHAPDPDRVYLMHDGATVGGYDYAERYFRYYDAENNKWLSHTTPPWTPPAKPLVRRSGVLGQVTDYDWPLEQAPPRGPSDEVWSRNGKAVGREELLALLRPKAPPGPGPRPSPEPPAPNEEMPSPAPLLLLFAVVAAGAVKAVVSQ